MCVCVRACVRACVRVCACVLPNPSGEWGRESWFRIHSTAESAVWHSTIMSSSFLYTDFTYSYLIPINQSDGEVSWDWVGRG